MRASIIALVAVALIAAGGSSARPAFSDGTSTTRSGQNASTGAAQQMGLLLYTEDSHGPKVSNGQAIGDNGPSGPATTQTYLRGDGIATPRRLGARGCRALALSPDTRLALLGCGDSVKYDTQERLVAVSSAGGMARTLVALPKPSYPDTLTQKHPLRDPYLVGAAFSPDGRTVVYATSAFVRTNVDATGTYGGFPPVPTFLYAVPASGGTPRLLRGNGRPLNGSSPAFTPDGQLVFEGDVPYSSIRQRTPPTVNLWQVGLDGRGLHRLTSMVAHYTAGCASVSPDGKTIALSVHGPTVFQGWTVELLDLSTGEIRSTNLMGACPRFSPDGTEVAYSRDGATPGHPKEQLAVAQLPLDLSDTNALQSLISDVLDAKWSEVGDWRGAAG